MIEVERCKKHNGDQVTTLCGRERGGIEISLLGFRPRKRMQAVLRQETSGKAQDA